MKYLNLDTDTTLGGNNPSDHVISSQKALKTYIDSQSGSTVDQTFDGTSANAQSGIAIYGALTGGSISPTFGNSVDISSANLYYDSDDDVLYNSAKTDFPEISINSNYSFIPETNAETGDDELLINSNITSDNIRWSAEGGIFVNTSISGGQFTYNGNEVATLSDIPSLTNYVTTNTDQNITGVKTYVGQKRICFKQSGSSDKLGFTLYNSNNVEKGYLEFNPTNTIDGAPLMTLGNYATAAAGITHVGFRKYSSVSGASGAYNLLAPLISNAKTPFNLTTTYTNFYLPLGFTDGTTMVTTANTGVVDLSSLIPSLSGYATEQWVENKGYITGISSSDITTALGYTPYNSTNPSGYQANVIETIKVNSIAQTVTNKAIDISVPTETTVSGWGFTKNAGTVTSVNNVSPVSGNVTLSIPTVTDTYSSTSSDAMSGKAVASAISSKQDSSTAVTHTANTAEGNANTPVYINSSGVATALSYTIAKSVPSNAVFTDTTYANGTGITIGTGNAINHSNSVTAGTAGTSSATSGSTLSVPYVTYDAQGHVTASGTHTHTVTGFSTTDTKNTAGSTDTSSKIFLVGATSQAANPQTYSHDTVFVDTSGQLNSANPSASTNSTVVATTKWVTDKGYTTNTGTITGIKMNGVSKGTSGVVDLGTVITDISGKQDTLVSGTSIKTINNTSLLGSGNIDTSQIFFAQYGTTTANQINQALSNGKTIICTNSTPSVDKIYYYSGTATVDGNSAFTFSRVYQNTTEVVYISSSTNVWNTITKTLANDDLSNVSSIDSGSAVATALDNKVSKSGDTMTGRLEIDYSSASDDCPIVIKSTNLEFDDVEAESIYPPIIEIVDSNNNRMGQFEYAKTANGGHCVGIVDKKDSETLEYASITVGWDSEGNRFSSAVTPSSVTSNNTNIATTAHVINVLKAIYPVGAIFVGTTSTCPMAQFFGTWALVAQDRVLQGSSTNHAANDTINASLPTLTAASNGDHSHNRGTMDITGSFNFKEGHGKLLGVNNATNCFSGSNSGAVTNPDGGGDTVSGGNRTVIFKASDKWSGSTNSTGAHTHSVTWTNHVGTTVQPPAYVVNVWRRTA